MVLLVKQLMKLDPMISNLLKLRIQLSSSILSMVIENSHILAVLGPFNFIQMPVYSLHASDCDGI